MGVVVRVLGAGDATDDTTSAVATEYGGWTLTVEVPVGDESTTSELVKQVEGTQRVGMESAAATPAPHINLQAAMPRMHNEACMSPSPHVLPSCFSDLSPASPTIAWLARNQHTTVAAKANTGTGAVTGSRLHRAQLQLPLALVRRPPPSGDLPAPWAPVMMSPNATCPAVFGRRCTLNQGKSEAEDCKSSVRLDCT